MFRRCLAKVMIVALAGVGLTTSAAHAQIGVALTGAGPVNRSMGGASTAAPLDAAGALFWNPATMSGLSRSELEFGAELLYPRTKVSSSLPANAFGPGIPGIPLSGSDRSDAGIFAIPSIGLVYMPEESWWTFGLGLYGSGGFGVNYSASRVNPLAGSVNPILTPQPPNGFGLGAVYSQFQIMQLAPSASYQLAPNLSVGFSPTINLANLSVDPDVFAPPNVNGAYSPTTHGLVTWGLGFQAGVFYTTDEGWSFGASVKSPQWLAPFRYNSTDQTGGPRTVKIHLDYPLMVSLGTSYTGFDRWILAADVRFVDFHDTTGFKNASFDSTGAVTGLGWDSSFCVALGAQYQLTDAVSLRLGYTFNTNPIPDDASSFNVASPTILEHTLYAGASYKVTETFLLSLAYAHAFQNTISGPLVTPFGTVLGSSITNQAQVDTLLIGATVKF